MDRDRIEGPLKEAGGKVKEEWGDLTDDPKTEAEGQAQQVEGDIQNEVGEAQDEARDAFDPNRHDLARRYGSGRAGDPDAREMGRDNDRHRERGAAELNRECRASRGDSEGRAGCGDARDRGIGRREGEAIGWSTEFATSRQFSP